MSEEIRLSQERLAALKELITPIKDLAKNWNVDINTELDNYMSQFDSDVNSENFAEAALIIQGSAGVWSKKVDFVYAFAVNSQTLLDEKNKEKSKGASREEEEESEDEMMTLGPCVIKKASTVHVDLSSLAQSKHFKPQLPLCLSAISIKDDGPENMLYNRKGELLASRDDFTINKCIIDKSGFASIEMQSYLLLKSTANKSALTPFFKRRVSQYDGFVNKSDLMGECEAAAAHDSTKVSNKEDMPESDVADMNYDDLDPGGALDLSDGSDEVGDDSVAPVIIESKTPMQRKSFSRVSVTPVVKTAVLVSKINQTLDPYQELPCKPFKKANIEVPKTNRKRKNKTPPKTSLSDMLEAANKTANPVKFANILRKPIYVENMKLFKNLRSKELSSIRNVKKKLTSHSKLVSLPNDLFEPPELEVAKALDDDDFNSGNVDCSDDDDFCGTISEHPQLDAVEEVQDHEISHNLEGFEKNQENALQTIEPTISYENLVRQHVMKYTSEAKNHYHVSELRTRVIEWENKITPVLEEEEKCAPFDVQHYSNKFMDKLSTYPDETTNIKCIMSGETKGEVCRLFLTSLMLTNSGNIDLQGDSEDAKCTLLTTKLFSDLLEGYVASDCSTSKPSSSRKRKVAPK